MPQFNLTTTKSYEKIFINYTNQNLDVKIKEVGRFCLASCGYRLTEFTNQEVKTHWT